MNAQLLILSLTILYVAALGIGVRLRIRSGRLQDLIPSLAWASLMLIPFALQCGYFDPDFVPVQAFGVFSIGAALLTGDLSALRQAPRTLTRDADGADPDVLLKVASGLALLSVALLAYHVSRMPQLPLLVKWSSGPGAEADKQVSLAREAASKTLHISPIFIYSVQCVLTFLGPLLLAVFFRARKYFRAAAYFAVLAIYSRITTAKAPLYVLCLLLFYVPWSRLSIELRKRLFRWGTVAAVAAVAGLATYLAIDPEGIFRYRVPSGSEYRSDITGSLLPVQRGVFTIPDHYRRLSDLMPDYNDRSNLLKEGNYFFYRAVLVPSEVSQWWYIYFPTYSGAFTGLSDMSLAARSRADFQHPANRVGKFAYVARHPDHYIDTVRAYASVDADAYSRFGIVGILATTLLLFLVRFAVNTFRVPGFWGEYSALCFLLILAITLPSGSLLAALVAQGAGPYFVLVLALPWLMRGRRVTIP